jgi:tRNA(Ile)-lysidine synthase
MAQDELLLPLERSLLFRWPMKRWCDVRCILAVSGGADSVALVRSLTRIITPELRSNLVLGHVNHGWRGKQSEADAQFVQNMAEQLGLEYECQVAVDVSRTEEAARDQRYSLLTDLAKKRGARYVLMAHSRDDQIETVLDRILRGTGLAGLRGIPRERELEHGIALVRPLLEVSRHEIITYLGELDQEYRHDGSNDDVKYTRNRIRHELLPLLKNQYHGAADEALLRLQQMASELQDVIAEIVYPLFQTHVYFTDGVACKRVEITCEGLTDVSPYLIRELFVLVWKQQHWPRGSMTRLHWQRLADAVAMPLAAFELPGGVRVERTDDVLVLATN